MSNYLILLLISLSSFAKTSFPLLTSPIVEEYSVLNSQVKQDLAVKIRQLYQEGKGPQVTVLIIDKIPQDSYLEEYSNNVFRHWGLGNEKRDDGVLFLIAVNSKKMRIEVGQGLEGVLTDYSSNKIISKVKPFFKDGNYSDGIALGVDSIISHIQEGINKEGQVGEDSVRQSSDSQETNQALGLVFLIIILVSVTFFIISHYSSSYVDRKTKFLNSEKEVIRVRENKKRLQEQLNEVDLVKFAEKTESNNKKLTEKLSLLVQQLKEYKAEYQTSDDYKFNIERDKLKNEERTKEVVESDIEYYKKVIKEDV
jgi:uncharacterized protein